MKQIYTLIVIFLVLVGGYFFVREYAEPKEFTPPEGLSLTKWKSDAIDSFQFQDTNSTVVIEKNESGKWETNGFLGDDNRIRAFLAVIEAAKVTSRASTNPENHERFVVDDKGTTVTLYFTDGSQEKVIVGKSAGGESVYVRLPEEDEVYVMDGVTMSQFATNASVWRDRTVLPTSASELASITFSQRNNTYTYQKLGETHSLQRSGRSQVEVSAEKVQTWLQDLQNLKAADFPSEEDISAGVENREVASIELERSFVTEGQPETEILRVYESDRDNMYLVVLQDTSIGYYVSIDSLDNVFPPYTDLLSQLQA